MRAPIIPADWPYREVSRHIACKPHLWHAQEFGTGPLVLLLHGAGGATHSFRHLIPLLSPHYRIVALDLPGQGFTVLGARGRCGLDPVAEDIAALICQQGWQPFAIMQGRQSRNGWQRFCPLRRWWASTLPLARLKG